MLLIQHSSRIVLGISIVLISILSIQEIEVESSIDLSDKFIHFSCFLYLSIISWLSRIIYKELWLYVIVLAYGILIEIVQIYIPYRSFEFLDIFADFLGIVVGSFFINFFKDLYPKY
ncbi:VanZ family protein [Pseudomonadota bacterium]|nr:VanZ family protein [Pseudomonadota bacterium]